MKLHLELGITGTLFTVAIQNCHQTLCAIFSGNVGVLSCFACLLVEFWKLEDAGSTWAHMGTFGCLQLHPSA
jgi:hypothetical protein